ncbi:heme ABC transporter ATP-binding protein [Algoriphagus aestuariicola]|uniref:Heme ABC transporter ATP-binding protein n=1 Tax=Algoriphagus aestuariicola TaxID=1852016 RepID=A0ABS3BT78_9BACT|nr:heme ABC transporter ATP-binding protein [Algoriphagus aestuariicola]MBN7802081.1 heme ABC transporter ATP-binding protein [Algoriphagus aestuariicola]
MLTASRVHFCIRQRPIVDEVSLELNPGEILAVLGPNGAGKSTFFKILSGEIRCKHGAIGYNGHDIHTLKSRELAEVRAVMPQHTQVNFPFTVQEVVELGLISTKAKNPTRLIAEVLEATNTSHLKDQVFNTLSGGEKQRVQLARVLVQIWEAKPFPRYLLLDEPTSSLDIAQQHAVLKILEALKSRNIGILVILHELNLAAQYADKIALLKDGLLAKSGTVKEVLDEEILAQVFDHPIQLIANPATGGVFVSSAAQSYSSTHTIKQA